MDTADEARALIVEYTLRRKLLFEKVQESKDVEGILKILLEEIKYTASLGRLGLPLRYCWMDDVKLSPEVASSLVSEFNARGFFFDISSSNWFIAWGSVDEPFPVDPFNP